MKGNRAETSNLNNILYVQVFPGLVDVVPEARLNLVIYHLKQDDNKEAYDLLKDVQPAVPQEYILKAVVNAALGQELNSVRPPTTLLHFFKSNTSHITNSVIMANKFRQAQRWYVVRLRIRRLRV